MFIGYKIYRSKLNILKPVLYIVGIAAMILALITFFERSHGYNDSTFSQTASLISLGLFGICAFCCFLQSVLIAINIYKNKNDKLRVAS
jgi:drug/metabolite transporter (DMT)-like permease